MFDSSGLTMSRNRQPMKQWEKAHTGSGVVYYVNHADKKTQWEHPNYQVMLEMLDDCNSIKYAAYRAASKLCVLQRFFNMNQVHVKCIAGVFEKHQMHVTENNLALSSTELEDIIYDILFASQTASAQPCVLNVELNTELILNFLLSVFDSSNRKSVKVLCAKVVLTILSASNMQQKIHYLFQQLSDHNQCISKRKMESFLQSCSSLMHYLAESLAFSSDLIKPTLRACFQGNDKFVGLSEDTFVRWFLSEPQILMWFPIFYRLKTAENELHLVKCAVCKMYPLRGLRYKCLRCINYDQCQNCFFNRRLSRRHKLRHPMQEYCWQTGSRRSTLEYLRHLIKRICGHESRLQYLPVEPSDVLMESDFDSTVQSQVTLFDGTLKPENELSNIIGLLESENQKLECEIKNIDNGLTNRYLTQHKEQIRQQIQRLRKVKTHINLLRSQPVKIPRMQSTPMLRYNQNVPQMFSFENLLSPITSSDTSGVSMTPESSLSSGPSSRVSPNDISTWIGKKKLSPHSKSHEKFDFSMLLCPKQVSSYRVIMDESDKENALNETASRRANSSFSLDEVLAKYECDSRFSSATLKSSRSSRMDRTKSLYDITFKEKKIENNISSRQQLSGLNKVPSCTNIISTSFRQMNNNSRLSTLSNASCHSKASIMTNSCENLIVKQSMHKSDKSLSSQDYLNRIAKSCNDMPPLQGVQNKNTSVNRKGKGCHDRIQRRKTIVNENVYPSVRVNERKTTSNNISSSTLPRMFKTPLQEKQIHFSNLNHNNLSNGNSLSGEFTSLPVQIASKSIDSLSSPLISGNSSKSFVSFSKSCDLSNSQKYEEWRCDSLNSLLSHEGVIEKSIGEDGSVQDEQLFQLQNEIDNILLKLQTILTTV